MATLFLCLFSAACSMADMVGEYSDDPQWQAQHRCVHICNDREKSCSAPMTAKVTQAWEAQHCSESANPVSCSAEAETILTPEEKAASKSCMQQALQCRNQCSAASER